jgi:hypothetical protein
MSYTKRVTFSSTNNYGNGPYEEDDVYTVEDFLSLVQTGMFIDDDGFGHPVQNELADVDIDVYPSDPLSIPLDATHIVWYNR